jgi:hypothetical protein
MTCIPATTLAALARKALVPLALGLAALAVGCGGDVPAPQVKAIPAAVPTAESTGVEELDLLGAALALVVARADSGEPIDASLLHTIAETSSTVAARIESEPDSISRLAVIAYIQTVANGREILRDLRVSRADEDALSEARDATQQGVVAASRYFVANPAD